MSLRPSPRWGVPAAVVLAVAAGLGASHALAASPQPSLPHRTPAQLVAAVEQSDTRALSGTVQTVADLGLPTLPASVTGGSNGLASLLSGTHTLRVWVDGPQRQRLALLGDLAETDVVRNGRDVWTYASGTNTVTHYTLPTRPAKAGHDAHPGAGPEHTLTPQAAAARVLDAIQPSTAVTVDDPTRVAGRPAYQLVIAPRTSDTTIGSIRIAIDARTSTPLRVEVFPRGSSQPAIETGFTEVSFGTPAGSVFAFTPPRGATVKQSAPGHHERAGTPGPHRSLAPSAQPRVVGQGWSSILVLPASALPAATRGNGTPGELLRMATTQTPHGRLLATRLLNVLFTPDGKVLAGAVPASSLERAAASVGG